MMTKVISSQANEAAQARALEGSETRATAKAMMAPRAPSSTKVDEDIVRYPIERSGAGLNSQQNTCHINPKVKSDLTKTFFPKERYNLFADGKSSNGMIGLDMGGFTSPAGDIRFEPNTFITDGGAPTAAVGDVSKRPAALTESTALAAAPDGGSLFAAEDAGSYTYAVQPVNRFGRGAVLNPGGGALAVAAGDGVTIGVTPSGTPLPDWYELYRSQESGTALRRIARVPNAAGAGEEVLTDLNASLPFTTLGFMFQQNLEAMSFKQLAPMVKIPLATIDSSIRWMQLLSTSAANTGTEVGALAA